MSTANTNRPVVLIGFAEAMSAPEVAWSLVDAGFDVVTFARRGRASALRHSRHVTCFDICPPEVNAALATADLQTVIGTVRERTGVLFPLDDHAVWLCSQLELPANWRLAGPSGGNAELSLDKSVQVKAAVDAGFNVPSTTLVTTVEELQNAVEHFPVILKAAQCAVLRDGRLIGSRNWICGNREELECASNEWGGRLPLLVQPFIEGVGEGIFGLATPDGVKAWSAHRRLRMMNPHGSGSSACVSQFVTEELKEQGEALVRGHGWRGLFMIELLRDASGRVWFVELNGRPWGSMALARRQGLEYPAWQVELALDAGAPPVNGAAGVIGLTCRHIGRELMHLLFVLRGPKSKAMHQWPSLWKAVGAVAGIRPSDAVYNWRWDDPMVFVSDCYHTVHDNVFKRKR